MSMVLTVGSFTSLHEDHDSLISFCEDLKGRNGTLRVGLNSSRLIKERKGFTPPITSVRINNMMNRYRDTIDYYNDYDPDYDMGMYAMIQRYSINVLAVGSDWAHPQDYMSLVDLTFKDLHELGCVLAFIHSLRRVHSSDFR